MENENKTGCGKVIKWAGILVNCGTKYDINGLILCPECQSHLSETTDKTTDTFNLKEKRKKHIIQHGYADVFYEYPEEDVKEFIRLLKEKPENFEYKVVNRIETKVDAWGDILNPPLKYSWRDIEYAIKLKLEQIDKLSGGL